MAATVLQWDPQIQFEESNSKEMGRTLDIDFSNDAKKFIRPLPPISRNSSMAYGAGCDVSETIPTEAEGLLAIDGGQVVSCIMPTYGRPDYVLESVAMFMAQDYSRKELLILNDCPNQFFETAVPNVRIFNSQSRFSRTVGTLSWLEIALRFCSNCPNHRF